MIQPSEDLSRDNLQILRNFLSEKQFSLGLSTSKVIFIYEPIESRTTKTLQFLRKSKAISSNSNKFQKLFLLSDETIIGS